MTRLTNLLVPHTWYTTALLLFVAAGCGARSTDATDTKTNWLSHCDEDDDCNAGLSCLCGVCSETCDEAGDCSAHGSDAKCFGVSHCGEVEAVCALEEEDLEYKPDVSTGADASSTAATETAATETAVSSSTTGGTPTSATPPTDATGGPTTQPWPEECRDESEYMALGEECQRIDYDCIMGMQSFGDECGCGCEPNPDCDPDATYIASQCEGIDFDCQDGEAPFTDACGCGCKPLAACDPTLTYVAYGQECQLIDFVCDGATSYFQDECGCGCAPNPDCDPDAVYLPQGACSESECAPDQTIFLDQCGCYCIAAPDPACADPNRQYLSTDVEYCQLAEPNCVAGSTQFADACGCGCTVPSLDGGAPSECPGAPAGDTIVSRPLVEKQSCEDGVTSHEVTSQTELDAVYTACGILSGPTADFTNKLVYVAVLEDHPDSRFLYAVSGNDGVHLGLESDAYCGGIQPPNGIVIVELTVAPGTAIVAESCVHECTGLPVP